MQLPQDDAESAAVAQPAAIRMGGAVMGLLPESSTLAHNALPESLARALRWLDARADEPVVLATIAAVAGVRPRTLEALFKRHLGTTPLGWVRRMRLARARQRLLAADGEASVTGVALANGFSQFGRFAAQYRRQFGELPSQTLKGMRAPPDQGADQRLDEAQRLCWRAVPAAFMVGPDACGAALDDAERAQELAPADALPKAVAAWCWSQRAAHNFGGAPQLDRARAQQLAQEASRLASHDALALSLASGALTLTGRLADADRLIERSLAIDPWSPWAWARRAWLSAYAGDDDGALRELQIALRLMPFEPLRHLMVIGIGCVHFNAGRYERAARWIADGVAAGPQSFWAERVLVAAAAHAGALGQARRSARMLLRKDGQLTVAVARGAWPFTPGFMERLGDGLAIAGIPRD
jgi:AraC-like DNA-binding protein